MFSLGELLLTGVVALIVLGPKRLPQAAYQLAKAMQKVYQLVSPVKQAFEQQVKQIELHQNRQRAETAEKQSIVTSTHESS